MKSEFVMDSGRIFRAVVMCLTLLGCLWVLSQLENRHTSPEIIPADTVRITPDKPQEQAKVITAPAPIEVSVMPLVAMDNTCYYDGAQDVSQCTGAISGGPAREYTFHATGKDTYYVGVEPRSEYFDLSLVVFDSLHHCVIGRDDRGAGYSEGAVMEQLAAGTYTLLVGGYGEDCGPYELTVSTQAPAIAQVTKSNLFPGHNGTVVRWETFAEVALGHFELYRQRGTERERIAILRAHGSRAGFAEYRFMDRSPHPDYVYVIEAVARDGRRETVVV